MNGQDRVASPCVRNCCLDDDDVCLGCFRSLPEICAWSTADDSERRSCLARAERRKSAKHPNAQKSGASGQFGGGAP